MHSTPPYHQLRASRQNQEALKSSSLLLIADTSAETTDRRRGGALTSKVLKDLRHQPGSALSGTVSTVAEL